MLNLAISGNALNHDGSELNLPEFGESGLNRLDDDIDPRPDVGTVIVDLGLNDLFLHADSAERLTDGLKELTAALHERDIRVLLATLSPAAGADNWGPELEATRQAVNEYIRTTDDADGVVDIDRAVRDPDAPTLLDPAYLRRDGVHPNAEGNRAIANAVPLWLLY